MREQIIKKADEILKQAQEETYGPYSTYYGDITAEISDSGVTFRLEMDESVRDQLIEESSKGDVIYDLLEDFIGEGWEWVAPEDIGALTDAPIITDPNGYEVISQVDSDEVYYYYVYWYPNYMVQSPVEDLIEKGETFFELFNV